MNSLKNIKNCYIVLIHLIIFNYLILMSSTEKAIQMIKERTVRPEIVSIINLTETTSIKDLQKLKLPIKTATLATKPPQIKKTTTSITTTTYIPTTKKFKEKLPSFIVPYDKWNCGSGEFDKSISHQLAESDCPEKMCKVIFIYM